MLQRKAKVGLPLIQGFNSNMYSELLCIFKVSSTHEIPVAKGGAWTQRQSDAECFTLPYLLLFSPSNPSSTPFPLLLTWILSSLSSFDLVPSSFFRLLPVSRLLCVLPEPLFITSRSNFQSRWGASDQLLSVSLTTVHLHDYCLRPNKTRQDMLGFKLLPLQHHIIAASGFDCDCGMYTLERS